MLKAIKEFFLKKFFFKIDKDEKEEIRQRVMQHDHKVYMILLPIIIVIEFVVLFISFINYGFSFEKNGAQANLPVLNTYRGLYVFFYCCLPCLCFLT